MIRAILAVLSTLVFLAPFALSAEEYEPKDSMTRFIEQRDDVLISSDVENSEYRRPRLKLKIGIGHGFYRMKELNNAYLATRREWSSLGNSNTFLGISESCSEAPGGGADFAISAIVRINDSFGAGIQMENTGDGFKIAINETRYSALIGSYTSAFIEGDIDARARTFQAVGVFYLKRLKGSEDLFLQLGIGYGTLDLKSNAPMVLKASDISPTASIGLGVESSKILGILRLELFGGVRWLRFKGFDNSGSFQIETQDLNAFETKMLNIYENGIIDFSGTFLNIGLCTQLF